jgi:hypothetical protein
MTVVRGIDASAVRQHIALEAAHRSIGSRCFGGEESQLCIVARSEISAPTDTRETSRSKHLWSPDGGM